MVNAPNLYQHEYVPPWQRHANPVDFPGGLQSTTVEWQSGNLTAIYNITRLAQAKHDLRGIRGFQ